jgi:hypothetical protein
MTTSRFLVVAAVTLGAGAVLLALGGFLDEPWLAVAGAACIGLAFLARTVWTWSDSPRAFAAYALAIGLVVVAAFVAQEVFG